MFTNFWQRGLGVGKFGRMGRNWAMAGRFWGLLGPSHMGKGPESGDLGIRAGK